MKTSYRNIAVVFNWILTVDWIRFIHNCGVGIGTLLVGIGGLAAFIQTSEIINKITELDKKISLAQSQINYIEKVVQEIKRKQIESKVSSLIKDIPLLQETNPTPESIKEALIKSPEIKIQTDSTQHLKLENKSEPYIQFDQIQELSNRISSTNDINERRKLLEEAIKIDMPSRFDSNQKP